MQEIRFKPFFAALITILLFYGIWYLGHLTGKVVFKNWNATGTFLIINALLWMAPIFLESITSKFSFKDHGFQLTVTAFVSLVALGSAANMKSFHYDEFLKGLAFIFVLLCMQVYMRSSRNEKENNLNWIHRLFSWFIGVLAAQSFLLVSINEEVAAWSLW